MLGSSTNSADLFPQLDSPLDPGLSSGSHFLKPETLQTALEVMSYKNSASSSLIDEALQSAEAQLRVFATDVTFTAKMNLAFGTDWDVNAAKDFAQSWLNGSFSALPTIEIRSGAEINEADGAFAAKTNTIYLSSDFLSQNARNPGAVTAVLLEEIGHAIDFRINKTDAAGDEGDIFSRLVRGETIGASELLELKAENDHTVISINGQSLDIEMSQIAMASFQGKLYEAHQGINNKIYTRYSLNIDATSWSDWKESGGETYNAPAMAALSNRLYESHRGTNNLIYTRYSTNGANWSEWKATDGLAYNAPTLAAVGDKLYQAHRGTDNNIYLRYATNLDATTWSAWREAGGQTYSAPALASFKGKLYEAHRGTTDNKIYTRYAINADANTWSEWKAAGDAVTENAPSMVEFKGNLYQSHRGLNNRIYTRSSRDGTNWTDWNAAAGDTPDGFAIASDAPSMTVVSDRLYQAHQGNDNKIYTRSSFDGKNWSLWTEKGGETRAESQIIRFDEKVDVSTNWNATVFIWDGNKGTAPSTDFYKNDPTNTTRIATLDLGKSDLGGGKQGLKFDWGTGSPDGENKRLPNDYFAVRAYTVVNFDGGQYTFHAKGDDGFQIMAKRQSDGKWFDITQGGWKSNEPNISATLEKGSYDIHFHYFERQGASNFDLSWEKTGRTASSRLNLPVGSVGIDVSHYQHNINWEKVKASGQSFAFVKATQGTGIVDSKFAQNWQAMQVQGIRRGAYHFFDPALDPETQARNFLKVIGTLSSNDMHPVLDLENIQSNVWAKLSLQSRLDSVKKWLDTVEQATGVKPIIYTSPSFWKTTMGNSQIFANNPLWIAHYTSAAQPTLFGGWKKWTFWQYTSSGKIDGIAGNVDQDRFNA